MNLVVKDAAWQIGWRIASAIGWFLVIKFITPYLGPLRFGDYSTILKYFAIRSAFADFGMYVIALKELGAIRGNQKSETEDQSQLKEPIEKVDHSLLNSTYSKFVTTRFLMIVAVYTSALVIAYLIPAYSSNPYLIWGLPLGMAFSATFMASWILQIPLQLYRKMEQVSIALILARISQLWVIWATIYWLYTTPWFAQWEGQSAFMMIIWSVVMSGVIQMLYTRWQWSKYLSFSRSLDRWFVRRIIWGNWQYGVAYYLSSFHMLLVLLVFSRLYPTTEWYTYVWIRALALSLIEIMLIIPSALWNSMIHDVSWQQREIQKQRYSTLLKLVVWIWWCVMIMCGLFAPHVIHFMGGPDYLTTDTLIWSDYILPFLSIVLLLSFIRQVHNYLFVTTWHQNTLLGINLFGVTVGLIIGLPLIITYGIQWGIITQILLEVLFLWGSLWVARREQISLVFPWKIFLRWLITALLVTIFVAPFVVDRVERPLRRISAAALLSISIVSWSRPRLQKTLRQL